MNSEGELKKQDATQKQGSLYSAAWYAERDNLWGTYIEVLDAAKKEWLYINKKAYGDAQSNFWLHDAMLERSQWFKKWFGDSP